MTRRALNKRAARHAREWRRHLVHSAGCVLTDCVTVRTCAMSAEALQRDYRFFPRRYGFPVRPVSVPKSLRHLLGRCIGV